MTVPEKKRGQSTIESFFKNTPVKRAKVTVSKEETIAISKIRNESAVTVGVGSKIVNKGMDKKSFKGSCSSMLLNLLQLEIDTIEDSWFERLSHEFKKPYFIQLKKFIDGEQSKSTVFPPADDIYSWSRLTPFRQVKVVIIGQDPYHNYNQAHGLAFSVKSPTPAPPSLKNIYKELKNEYPDYEIDNNVGDLTPWAKQGVLLLNTALTVKAHNANSHSKAGWSDFTKEVVQTLINDRIESKEPIAFLLWGNNAIRLVETILTESRKINKSNLPDNFKLLKSVHPSPLSASRGFFGTQHFKQINDWLYTEQKTDMIDWSVVPGSKLAGIKKYCNMH
ncbi:hypothetical protein TPHA_0D02540 [Tetrapisispora phaffii CBS 4417]|uniref:Uracil-DNA glycosylase n=1 Tax=Tetrapisispora phaffii (strain ATCC 24235 / CBS 4417 / NBRC 1672 / NRRL Y-8282 / UCD 70-5) TaxID=1071381 RepID=G8BSS0_TETPH|nr:hypothetical protein TPHA_0D02540 [Tetrapisispora phaffii CBS 4417]CCE62891.1 hypothetical protein TPHA_0D02540 [Tetrapisispora phaffii CBS 4417]